MGTHPLIIELIKIWFVRIYNMCIALLFSTTVRWHLILQVGVNDWKEGVLPTQYLLQKLEETTLALQEYETQVAPTGWAFVWDRWVFMHLVYPLQIT